MWGPRTWIFAWKRWWHHIRRRHLVILIGSCPTPHAHLCVSSGGAWTGTWSGASWFDGCHNATITPDAGRIGETEIQRAQPARLKEADRNNLELREVQTAHLLVQSEPPVASLSVKQKLSNFMLTESMVVVVKQFVTCEKPIYSTLKLTNPLWIVDCSVLLFASQFTIPRAR